MYNDIKLEKGLYNLSGKCFSEALEELDPSAGYIGTPLENLDAYERQLKRYNIRVSGENCDRVEKFFSSTETAVLFPEFVARCIRRGFDETVIASISAAKTICESGKYLGCDLSDQAAYTYTTQGNVMPQASITEAISVVSLNKYGRYISATYEAVRKQRLDVFGVMLSSVGVKLAASAAKSAVTVLASNSETITTTELTYSDLAELYGKFSGFDMTTIITSPAVAAKIAAMEQLSDTRKDPDGKMILPFGAELIKTSAADNNTIIGIDRSYALEFITNSGLIIETDKLIDRQLDQIAVSISCGFRKIAADAVKVLSIVPET